MPLPQLVFKKSEYPQSKDRDLPRQFFVAAFIGPRGQGKTYSACQVLKAYENSPPMDKGVEQEIRTFIISPTFDANECFRALKSIDKDDVYRSYGSDVLQEIQDKIVKEKEATERFQKEMAAWRRFQRVQNADKLKLEDLLMLEKTDFQEPEKPRYPNGVSNFMVLDDLVGSDAYKTGRNPLTNLLLRNRHHRLNIMIMAQHLKGIPRSVRSNVSLWWIGKFGSRTMLPELYEEIGSAMCTEPQFDSLYDQATAEPYGSLVVDFSKPKASRFSINLQQILSPGGA